MGTWRSSSTCRSATALLIGAALMGCGGSQEAADAGEPDASFGAEPLSTLSTDDGALSISLRTAPQPPVRGVNAVRLDVGLADGGAAPEGLTLDFQTWMPAMGHGTSVKPSVQAVGGGRFDVKNVWLPMPGTWELRLNFGGPVSSHATANVDVP